MKLTKLQEYILDDYLGCGTSEESEISADIIEELKSFDSVSPKLLKEWFNKVYRYNHDIPKSKFISQSKMYFILFDIIMSAILDSKTKWAKERYSYL